MLHRGARTGLAVVVSDLFDEHGFQRGLDQLRYRRFDAHVIQLHDPKEADPALLGDAELVDMETDSSRKVTVTERNLKIVQTVVRRSPNGRARLLPYLFAGLYSIAVGDSI